MGEAKRRKLAGTRPTRSPQPPSRDELIVLIHHMLALADDDVTGITLFTPDGSDPVYISASTAQRRKGHKPDT